MFGKTLSVVEYNLTFGTNPRLVNVFGCFKYKKNNNLYVVYTDVNTKYEIIYYGSSHIKNDTILSMSSKNEDSEIIKEFIYKVVNNEDLSDFDFIDIKDKNGIEIIASGKLEIKLDVIKKLEELTIPKKIEEIKEDIKKPKKEKDKKSNKLLLILLISIIILGGGYFYFESLTTDTTTKKIICQKEYKHTELNAMVTEENTYIFYNGDILNKTNLVSTFKFITEESYQDFINRGLLYKYIPDDEENNSWQKDDSLYTFKFEKNEMIDNHYNSIKNYEEIINRYSNMGYSCKEQIEKE